MSRVFQAVAVAALLLMRPSNVRACSIPGSEQHQVNPALTATDTTAPVLAGPIQVETLIVESDDSGCGGKCGGGSSWIQLKASAMDDQSPPERIGYRLTVVGGTVPAGISLPRFDTAGSVILIPWSPEQSGDSFRFELSVAPIDEAGNVGEAQRVVVERMDGGGCAMNPMSPSTGGGGQTFRIAAIAMVAATMLRLRRRRGAR